MLQRVLVTVLMPPIMLGAVVVLIPATVSAPPASAAVADVTCTPPSSSTASYSPPLGLTPQTTTVTTNIIYGPCVSASVPGLISGSAHQSFPIPSRSCLDLLDAAPVTSTITWNTGQTSTVTGNRSATTAGAVLQTVITGTISSGLFASDTVVQTRRNPGDRWLVSGRSSPSDVVADLEGVTHVLRDGRCQHDIEYGVAWHAFGADHNGVPFDTGIVRRLPGRTDLC